MSILATDRALVIIADDGTLAADHRCARPVRRPDADDGIAAGVHVVVDTLVDSYAAAVEVMEETTDALTASLFDDRPMGRPEQLRAFQMRQAISHLRKVASPMTEVTAALAGAAARITNDDRRRPGRRAAAGRRRPAGSPTSPTTPGMPPTPPSGCGKC